MGTNYSPRIVTDGLIVCLDAKDIKSYSGSGSTWTDRSQNSNNATLYGPTFSNELFLFDGTNDYIDLPNDLGYTTAVTAIAWFKRNGDAAGGYQIIFGGQELEISIPTGNGKIRTGTYNGSSRYVNEAGSGLLDNNWHQVAVSLDNATTTKIAYIDGVRVGTQSFTGSIVSSFSYRRIGRWGNATDYYTNGYIPVVHIYNRALTDDEVKHNFNAIKGRFGI